MRKETAVFNFVVLFQFCVSDDRTVKRVVLRKPDGRRKVGRPKLRWLDCT
jgi:hypothetical protein